MAFRIRAIGFGGTTQRYLTLGITSESPVSLSSSGLSHDQQEVAYEPIFFSPNRLLFKELIFLNPSGLTFIDKPASAATYEYVRLLSPAGVQWVYGLGDDGLGYLQPFDSGVPYERRSFSTVMHKGQNLWVADPRQKPPIGGV